MINVVKISNCRGCEDVEKELFEGSILDYVKEMDEELLDYYLNWNVGDKGDDKLVFEDKMVEGKDVVILEGEESVIVMGKGDDFYRIVGKVWIGWDNECEKYVVK